MAMKRKILYSLIILLIGAHETALGQSDGGLAGGFLRYGVGGRALGMGRAFVAVSDDASGIYWNPAGIVGAERLEFSSMYSNLFYDSQYGYFGAVVPRPLPNIKDPLLRFLFGPSSALGFGWVGMSMVGFEQRDQLSNYLGTFGLQQNGFFFSWARESIWSWGVLRSGVTCKLVNQSFPDMSPVSSAGIDASPKRTSAGLDLGFTFQPVHAPLFKVISLRYLLPLRFGLTMQNIIRPRWSDADADRFPFALRWGLSYRWIMQDWIPESWGGIYKLMEDWQVLTVFDKSFVSGGEHGTFAGAEILIPITDNGITLTPRLGVNNRSEKRTFGCGISLPFSSSALIRIDYAFGGHRYLEDDHRFFLTIQTGGKRDAAFFWNMAASEDASEKDERINLYRVLASYPNPYAKNAAENLSMIEDSSRAPRYYDFTGGLGWAEWLFRDATKELKRGRINTARNKAWDAAKEYTPIYLDTDKAMTESETLNYGESLLMAGKFKDALSILQGQEDRNLRTMYLMGTCQKELGLWDDAEKTFNDALKRYKDEQNYRSMVSLSAMGLAETQIHKKQYNTAVAALELILKYDEGQLDEDYPRYPPYGDNFCIDEAQFLIGICLILSDNYESGVAEILKAERFYPSLEMGALGLNVGGSLVELLIRKDYSKLKDQAEGLLKDYFKNHSWPVSR